MISKMPPTLPDVDYEEEARAYMASLPMEHYMEAPPQAMQRQITVESLELIASRRADFQVYSELLIQYPFKGHRKPRKVVPDNMVVLTTSRIEDKLSYSVPLEPVGPFWVLEYISEGNPRKDYVDSRYKYERELKVPYYLLFRPADQELTLFHHNGRRYAKVKANDHGRYAIKELDLEVGLLNEYVRYWHKGDLLPLPVELQAQLDVALRRAEEYERQAEESKRQADESKRQADESRRQADESKRQANDLQRRLTAAEQEIARLRGPH